MSRKTRQSYAPPEVVQAVSIRLEHNLLASLVNKIQPVETAGQEIQEVYDASNTSTFNYDWNDTPLE